MDNERRDFILHIFHPTNCIADVHLYIISMVRISDTEKVVTHKLHLRRILLYKNRNQMNMMNKAKYYFLLWKEALRSWRSWRIFIGILFNLVLPKDVKKQDTNNH